MDFCCCKGYLNEQSFPLVVLELEKFDLVQYNDKKERKTWNQTKHKNSEMINFNCISAFWLCAFRISVKSCQKFEQKKIHKRLNYADNKSCNNIWITFAKNIKIKFSQVKFEDNMLKRQNQRYTRKIKHVKEFIYDFNNILFICWMMLYRLSE